MENATKALLIAGAILVAMVIVSTAIYLYNLFSNQSKEYNQIISVVELEKFNSKFNVYVGRNDIRAQEIVSVVNLAKEYNEQVQIYMGNSLIKFTSSNTPEEFIKSNQDKTFSCKVVNLGANINPEYDEYGKIKKLRFVEN